MSSRNSFLPAHPKIIKKINSDPLNTANSFITSLSTSRHESLYDSRIDETTHAQLTNQILINQKKNIDDLTHKIIQLRQRNEAFAQSLKFFDVHQQEKQILKKIEEAKHEQALLIQKIDNCEKVQKSTTAEEYYLWQKRKKDDAYNIKLEQIKEEEMEERERLKNICINYGKALDETKQEMQMLIGQITMYRNGVDVENEEEEIEIDEIQLNDLKEHYQDLKSTVELMRESNTISKNQFHDNVEHTQHELNKAYSNNKSSLIKDLIYIKQEIDQSPAEPPSLDQNTNIENSISDYQKKIKELRESINENFLKECPHIFQAFDWRSLDWRNYLGEDNNEILNSYDRYHNIERELEQKDNKIKEYEKDLMAISQEMAQAQQKSLQIQQNMSRAYRLTTSIK